MAEVVRSGQVQDRLLKIESTGLLAEYKWESSTTLNPKNSNYGNFRHGTKLISKTCQVLNSLLMNYEKHALDFEFILLPCILSEILAYFKNCFISLAFFLWFMNILCSFYFMCIVLCSQGLCFSSR